MCIRDRKIGEASISARECLCRTSIAYLVRTLRLVPYAIPDRTFRPTIVFVTAVQSLCSSAIGLFTIGLSMGCSTIGLFNHWAVQPLGCKCAVQPLCCPAILLFKHWAVQPLCCSTIGPINHRAVQSLGCSTIGLFNRSTCPRIISCFCTISRCRPRPFHVCLV